MNTPPTGTVTFLFTDIEGSTRLWEERPDEMRAALAEHDALLRAAIDAHGGYVFSTGGDGFAAAFSRAHEAVDAALNAQAALADHPLIRVRMGIYTGEVQERDGDYFGPAVNRAARIMAAGHGGQVLLSQTTADLDGRADLRALGEHRLRDLASPVSLWQVGHQTHPALRTLEGLRHNLPIQPTSLVGREDDAKSVQSLLRSSRLVTLTGVGGVGKTRLALQVAADVASEYPDGVFLVELATVRSVQEVGGVIATAMGIEVRAGDPLDQIREVVGSRKMLLVLDNCEHLLDGVAAAAATLLSRCAGLHFVATSREPLGVAGETTERVRSLPVGDSGVGHAEQLFMQRALAALPEFAPDDSARKLISGICQRLDGIPLAIELAAARVRTLSVADISARLDQRFRLLTGGSRTALERHQTLRAAVEWSYSLLTADQQVVLDRISVFAGGFDLDAAEAVIGVDPIDAIDVLDHLAALTERSLLNADTTGGPTRYRLLETIRQFAREKLVARDEADTFADRHATYYMERMTTRRIRRFEAGVADFVAFETDVDNLRAAFDYFVDGRRDREVARSGLVLADLWGFCGVGQERERVNQLLAAFDRVDDETRAHALSAISYPLFWGSDAVAAADAARQALAIETHPERLDPLLFAVLGHTTQGIQNALRWFDQGIANARQMNDRFALVESLAGAAGWLGSAQMGDLVARYSDELRPLMAVAGDISRTIGYNAIVSGRIYTDPRSIFELLDEDLCGSLGRLAGWTQHWFGCACAALGEHRRAVEYFRQAAAMGSDRGFWPQALMTLRWGGATLVELGHVEVAIELYAAADVSSHWEFDVITVEDGARQVQRASESLPTDVLAAARGRGAALSLSEALARFIETCDRILARVPDGSGPTDEQ